ncbi:glycosyltransferase family 39 protein [Acidimicrobiia bacterium]|nr:glycosyltransferase family 39 protein [Acidimicrobiia bacterium]
MKNQLINAQKKLDYTVNFLFTGHLLKIYSFFIILVFLTQFSSIGNEVIDWDETDFILMGNSFYEGNLPYTELWDLKPPVHFILIGFTFKIFGPSLLVTRLLGDFLIFLSSALIYHLTKDIFTNFERVLAASVYIIFVSFDFSQPTMTEFTATFFILLSLTFLKNKGNHNFFFSGFAISLSVLTRTNIAFVVIGLLVYFYKHKVPTKKVIMFLTGGVTPLFTFILVYLFEGYLKEFLYSVFVIPLGNTVIRENFLDFIFSALPTIFLDGVFSIQIWSVFLLVILLKRYFINSKKNSKKLNMNLPDVISVNVVIFSSILFSILLGGRFFYHYLIQLFPFASILLIFFIKNLYENKSIVYIAIIFLMFSNILFPAKQSIYNLINYSEIERNYEIKSFVKYIDSEKSLLALDNHLIYFYTGITPITPVVHPNTIAKVQDYKLLLEQLKELGYIVENQFNIILENKSDYLFCEKECNLYISDSYFQDYTLIVKIKDLKLYQLND